MSMRAVRLGRASIRVEPRADGSVVVHSDQALGAYPTSIMDAIEHWARTTPDAPMIADRGPDGKWRRLSYGEVVEALPPLAQGLLDAGVSVERPLVILSGNEIEHLLLGLAAMWVGVPYAPISPAYSLIATDFAKLRHIAATLTPGLVYAADGEAFGPAIAAAFSDTPLVVRRSPPEGRRTTLFEGFARTSLTAAVAQARAAVTPETIAKVLFTSGSTDMPKGVITTHRMLSCNQEMIRTALAFLRDEPPVLLDWMPWNHVAGGSHNTGIAFFNGGTFYVDDGQPTPSGIGRTLRNIVDVRPTVYFSVPKGYEFLVAAFAEKPEVRAAFFSRLQLMQYAGASLSQHVFDGLDEAARAETGQKVAMITGYGSTETAPFAFTTSWAAPQAGHIGLPAAGMSIKLVPTEGKLELRLKGPNVTPGYWRDAAKTALAFDEDGFYRIGDAVRPVDPSDYAKGFIFDGRLNEDFKLSTGTWVNFGAVRKAVIDACAPLIRDVVLTGADRNYLGALIFPDLEACRRQAELTADAAPDEVLGHARVAEAFRACLTRLARSATGSSNHVARALVMTEPPSMIAGEVTDKGSINQRAVLTSRADLVGRLYAEPADAAVLHLPRMLTPRAVGEGR